MKKILYKLHVKVQSLLFKICIIFIGIFQTLENAKITKFKWTQNRPLGTEVVNYYK